MNKVKELIKLLHSENQEVKNFFNAMMIDPDIEVNTDENGNIYMKTPKDFSKNINRKVDDILSKYLNK